MGEVVLALEDVSIRRDGRALLADVDWTVAAGERWVVIGPNGSGKTTLLSIAGARLHPSTGTVEILGERLGASDWRAVRARVGFVSGSVVRALRASLDALDIVVTGKHGALEPWWHTYSDADRSRALELMALTGVDGLADRPFGVISEGERQQVLLARLLMGEPGL
ncbi:MAG TPA: ATP-binding cassette domain-containing protein, partial [Acidimicrobiia bacterium]